MLKTRAGFTLIEVLVAMTITAIIGAAVTGVFVTQSRFFDHQEKTNFARGVGRGAMNIMMSELRMLERDGGVVSATPKELTIQAPYALGVSCGLNSSRLVVSQVPADPVVTAAAAYSGYAYRNADGTYTYAPHATGPNNASASHCTGSLPRIRVIPAAEGGAVIGLLPGIDVPRGTPVLLYQQVTYEFKASNTVPGRLALWRTTSAGTDELVAPFDTTARFRFYVNDAATPVDNAPANLSDLTGIRLVLDGMSERPDRYGNLQRVPVETSVFFRNR